MKKLTILFIALVSAMSLNAMNVNFNFDAHAISEKTTLQSQKDPAEIIIYKIELITKLTDEQKVSIRNIAKDINFSVTDKVEKKKTRREFRKRIISEVLTDAQKELMKSKRNQ
jgi:hypothetical protein